LYFFVILVVIYRCDRTRCLNFYNRTFIFSLFYNFNLLLQ